MHCAGVPVLLLGVPETLSRRALNRALLARQLLLAREAIAPIAAIERLVGLQAQQPRPPFIGLWSRLADFERAELRTLLETCQVVRGTAMRCTLHLMSARDYLAFRPVLQPVLTGSMQAILRERTATFEIEALLTEARRLFGERPRTFTEVRTKLLRRFPGADERAMGYAVRTHLPLVVAPAEHDWGFRADPEFTLAEEWLGEPLPADEGPAALVLRYLAAFGPAAASDAQAWCGLGGLATVLDGLRSQLVVFRDERKRELFDLPEAPRPPVETPAPVRFVADFDNLILGHAHRTRIIAEEHRSRVVTKNLLVLPTFLVDGFVAGTWKVSQARKNVILNLTPFQPLPTRAMEDLAEEGERLAGFVEPEATGFDLRAGE